MPTNGELGDDCWTAQQGPRAAVLCARCTAAAAVAAALTALLLLQLTHRRLQLRRRAQRQQRLLRLPRPPARLQPPAAAANFVGHCLMQCTWFRECNLLRIQFLVLAAAAGNCMGCWGSEDVPSSTTRDFRFWKGQTHERTWGTPEGKAGRWPGRWQVLPRRPASTARCPAHR